MKERFERIVRLVVRRPVAVLVALGVLALGAAVLALRLEPSASTDTLVNRSSESFKETERFKHDFGDDAVIVLVKGDLQRTVLTSDLGRLLRLEGCLSGKVPAQGLRQLPPGCTEIAKLKPAQVVYGPGTFINTAAGNIADQFNQARTATAKRAQSAASAARKLSAKRGDPPAQQARLAKAASDQVASQFTRQTLQLALRYGLTGLPSLQNADFVSSLVFDKTVRRAGQPKARFSYLFPSPNSAAIQVRLRPGLSDAQRKRAVALFREVASERVLKPQHGAHYVVTGVPVVTQSLATAVQHSIFWLLGAALLVMAATLALVFRSRPRLLPLGLALAAAALTFGALSLAGGTLTMASIAVLPVLIGLAVDYAIQFQARYDEQRERPGTTPEAAAVAAAGAGGPTIATAGLATAIGFLVLLLSPVPMVRGFGVLLVLGIALALVCALTAGFAALVLLRRDPAERPSDLPPALPRARQTIDRAVERLRGSAAAAWISARARRGLDFSLTQPRKVLAVGLAIAIVGWVVDTQSKVISDVRELVPQDLQALRDVNTLQRETGVSGEIDVAVRAPDITDSGVISWMSKFQAEVLKRHGYKEGERCSQKRDPPELCPALSLTDLFGTSQGATSSSQVRALLDSVPAYLSEGVVSRDHKVANIAFGIRLMPLDRQEEVVNDIRSSLDPPNGVKAAVVGLPVLAADANDSLSSTWRRTLTLLAALAGVFLVLLVVRRSRRWAAIPLIPIALATGWSGGILFILSLLPGPFEVDLNPMSVTLGALVIAISTEFSVLLSSRYRQEREAGAGPTRAIELAYASTGAAVLASGVTAIAGFAALMASDIRMLRDFGIVTVVDLTVSLVGVMLVLPAALLWAEEHGPFALRDLDPRPVLSQLWQARPRRADA